jgi:hypothetical protein
MNRRHRLLLLGAMVGLGIGLSTSHGADEKKKDSKASEPIKAAIKSEPVFISGTACRDGNCQPKPSTCRDGDCTPRPMAGVCAKQPCQERPAVGSCLARFGKWLFYRAPETPCECKGHLPPYRPPLIAWFPCKPGECGVPREPYGKPILVAPRPDAPPPLPPTPQITKVDRPIGVTASSAAMAEKPLTVKKAEPPAKKQTSSPSINFRKTETYSNDIVPIEMRTESRWEKSPR